VNCSSRSAPAERGPTPVHDYFHILGVSDGAPADEIRRAARRHLERSHPDFRNRPDRRVLTAREPDDVAIDFVDMAAIVERMQTAFFGPER
jgi:hypothetical protein